MNKIFLIISREYITRVRKKSFIIMSIIGPLLFGLMFAIPIWLATQEGDEKVIEILDESGYFKDKFTTDGSVSFVYIGSSLDSAKADMKGKESYGLLYIPKLDLDKPENITFFGEKNPSIEIQGMIENMLRTEIEDIKLNQSGIDKEQLEKIKTNIDLDIINMTDVGEKEGDVIAATAAGYIASLLIYMFIFMYGIQTMRSVIEEKTSRIVEVIISSVKPFQLMMGKIIGVGAVGLTQFLIWIVLTLIIYQSGITIYGGDMQQNNLMSMIVAMIATINFPLLLGAFLFYFIGAYFFYGALFAAVGSAVDSDSDAQQFQLPITLPLILSIILLSAILRDPHGNLAFWASVIPFTSPVVMMMRIPFDPPAWQIALSMVMLVLGFIFTTWLAGRIYRVGILMHGTKVNYRILAKWFMMKN